MWVVSASLPGVPRHCTPVAIVSHQAALPIGGQLPRDECRPPRFGRLLNPWGVTPLWRDHSKPKVASSARGPPSNSRLTSELRIAGAATRSAAEQVLSHDLLAPGHLERWWYDNK